MIVRKPYAFLIKYFKIIHILLFILMTYLLFRTRNIYMFFKGYLQTGTYTFVENMVNNYINVLMIISTIILIVLLLLIYFLMRQKEKPVFYYLVATIFYTVMFILFLYLMTVFSNLEYQTYSNQFLVIMRDISMVLYYLSFYFLAISFIRGFGFNVKKFNFEKDIKELDITAEDREEIEVGVEIDVDNVSNFIRKGKRNFGYYLKENSFILILLLVLIIIFSTSYILVYKLVLHKTYHEDDLITINEIDYKIKDSYLTNKDKFGNYIKDKDTNYLVILFEVTNKSENNKKLETKNLRVKVKDKYYYPISNTSNKFTDFGTIYRSQSLRYNVSNNYILVFEIDKVKRNIIFELYKGKRVSKGEVRLFYEQVKLAPKKFKESNLGTYQLLSKVDLSKTYLGKGEFILNSYQVLDMVDYTYTKCNEKIENGKCIDYKASVVPGNSKKILKIDYTINLENVNLFDYLEISYSTDNSAKVLSGDTLKNVTPVNYQDKAILFEVPANFSLADDVKFNFNVRGALFVYE